MDLNPGSMDFKSGALTTRPRKFYVFNFTVGKFFLSLNCKTSQKQHKNSTSRMLDSNNISARSYERDIRFECLQVGSKITLPPYTKLLNIHETSFTVSKQSRIQEASTDSHLLKGKFNG